VRERKVITVLFADLVGFTAQSEQLDPEDVADILGPYHERLRSELERWGGTVEKFIGDAVVAFFGAPVAGEDDPERAVRAALAIRDWIVDEGKLEVRIAVNTGEALVDLDARPESGEGMATGDVVNTTARLQAAAPTNGILAGETTYRATADAIDFRRHEAVEAKGKAAPVPVWEVVQARARFGVDLAGEARAPLVGREREIELLLNALARVNAQRTAELVTLVGVPGIGKSRLVAELFHSVELGGLLTYWRQGRSLPYGQGVSFWALAEMVKAQAGILETDSDEDVDAKLASAVEAVVIEDAAWVLSHVRPLVGQGDAPGTREEAFAAWRRLFESMAEQHPLILVFEDIQWADEGLLDFIEQLADWVRDVPMLILCTARLELMERRPAWGGGKVNAATVQLAPLSDEQMVALMSALGADAEGNLVERCGGNPLYAEQFARMLEERGEGALPETVQGIIAARLDALAPDEKALLQDAAVLGKVFWLGALGASEQQLHALRQKEFVQRARRSSVEGETEYAFKHVLVRDVAYGQIPRANRAQKHVRAAEWIESLGRSEDHAEMVAHHYVNALELTRAAGRDADELVERTVHALCEAGERALALNAVAAAVNYLRQAHALAPDDTGVLLLYGRALYVQNEQGEPELKAARARLDPERAAEASLMLADIAWKQGRRKDMEAYLEEAVSSVAGLPPSRLQVAVLNERARYDMLAGRVESAVVLAEQALAMAEELGLDDQRLRALNTIGVSNGDLGDPASIGVLEEVIESASHLNLPIEQIRAWNNVTALHILHGDLRKTQVGEAETLRLARHYGLMGFVRFIESGASVGNRFHAGEWDDALARADKIAAELAQGLPTYGAGATHAFRGLIRLARDDAAAAEADAERAVEHGRTLGDAQGLNPEHANAAFIFVSVGNRERADVTVTEALDNLRRLNHIGLGVMEAHVLAWAALSLGREAEVVEILERERFKSPWLRTALAVAARDFSTGANIMGEGGFKAYEAFLRLQSGGEQDVRLALDFYRGVRATRYIREAEELLAVKA